MKLIGIVVAVVVVGGVAAFFIMNPTSPSAVQNTNVAVQPGAQNTGAGAFTGSIAELLGRGGDWQCTFEVKNEVSESTGTVYVSGQKMRGDFASLVPQLNQTIDSHMIQNDGSVYVWTSLSSQGFQSATTIGTPDGTTAFKDQGVDINQAYNYDCAPWTFDSAKFELPAGVTFAGA